VAIAWPVLRARSRPSWMRPPMHGWAGERRN
jgi:hypothetical protein